MSLSLKQIECYVSYKQMIGMFIIHWEGSENRKNRYYEHDESFVHPFSQLSNGENVALNVYK